MSRISRLFTRRAAVGTAAGALSLALVAGVAVVANGYERQRQDMNSASVWVVNQERGLVGNANTASTTLSTAIKSERSVSRIAQDGTTVVMHSDKDNTLTLLDSGSASIQDSVELPSGKPKVTSSGSWLSIVEPNDGSLWTLPLSEAARFEASNDPLVTVGAEAVASIDEDGRWAGYSQRTSRVMSGGAGREERTQDVSFSQPASDAQVSLVGGEPAVYNPASNELWYKGSTRSLQGVIADPATAKLMLPTTQAGPVLLGHRTGLISTEGGDVRVVAEAASGRPAAPERSGSCVYGAWSSGTASRWCDGQDPESLSLEKMPEGATPQFVSNSGTLVLSDPVGGNAWAVQNGGGLIDNWPDFEDKARPLERERDDMDVPPKRDTVKKPPRVQDDTFGARAGRANVLPVLLNDSDPNRDPLLITKVTQPASSFGTVEIVDNGQKVQLQTSDDAKGSATFTYTVDDGNGGQATGNVTINIAAASQNDPPVQARVTKTTVAQGSSATLRVLEDWVDPESDPVYLVGASADGSNQVTFTPDGRVDFTHGGGEPGIDRIYLDVSDGNETTQGRANVTVGARGKVDLIAENYTLSGYAGNSIETLPLGVVRGGTGDVRLTSVTGSEGKAISVTPNFADGKVTIVGGEPGTYMLSYAVADDSKQASGTIRVTIEDTPDAGNKPVVMPTSAFLYVQNTTDVDVLSNAYDPAGRVLQISSVEEPPAASGIKVDVQERRKLKVTLTSALEKPVQLAVTVTNGETSAEGLLTLVNVKEPSSLQPPVARPDRVTARAGQVVDIPVMANDEQPDGKPITLDRTLSEKPKAGLLVSASDRLRYLAPSEPGVYTARYTAVSADGQRASAKVDIDVRPADPAGNRPPVAPMITGRATAGEKVTIPIDLTSSDPDGDVVSLVGLSQSKQPSKGAVTNVEKGSIDYTPFADAAGTDSFEYIVQDALGAQSTGTVRVGVAPRTASVSPPNAIDDVVTTRPGARPLVNVLDNDGDIAAEGLRITSVTSTTQGLDASFEKGKISFTAPEKSGVVGIMYTVANSAGVESTAWLYATVDKDAPLAVPTTRDIELNLADVTGQSSVPVDVLRYTELAEGSNTDLSVSLPEGWSDATVQGEQVMVPVQRKATVVPYTVSRKDDPSVGSTSFITVPGTDTAKPEVRPDAPLIEVEAGKSVDIPLADHVVAADDRTVTVEKNPAPTATKAKNPQNLIKDDKTLVYTAADDYAGQASITATVTDGRQSAPITLPITVRSSQNQSVSMQGTSLEMQPGESKSIDLAALTTYAQPDKSKLRWSLVGGNADVASATIEGSTLRLKAANNADNKQTVVAVQVTNPLGQSEQAQVVVRVVGTTKPPVAPVDDELSLEAGQTKSINVLANDESTNPFPTPLKVQRWNVEAALKGVTVTAAGGTFTATAGQDASAGTVRVTYWVADETGEADRVRSAQLIVKVVVKEKPGAPTILGATADDAARAARVRIKLAPAAGTADPVTKVTLRGSIPGLETDCTAAPDSCLVRDLPLGKEITFTATATNAAGTSAPSNRSNPISIDAKPGVPRGLTASMTSGANPAVKVAWKAPEAGSGSAVKGYSVSVRGPGVNLERSLGASTLSTELAGGNFRGGASYQVSVRSVNATVVSDAATTSIVAVGRPSVSGLRGTSEWDSAADRAVTRITWTSVDNGGGGRAVVTVARGAGGSCDPRSTGTGSSPWTDTRPPQGTTTYAVDVSNGTACSRETVSVTAAKDEQPPTTAPPTTAPPTTAPPTTKPPTTPPSPTQPSTPPPSSTQPPQLGNASGKVASQYVYNDQRQYPIVATMSHASGNGKSFRYVFKTGSATPGDNEGSVLASAATGSVTKASNFGTRQYVFAKSCANADGTGCGRWANLGSATAWDLDVKVSSSTVVDGSTRPNVIPPNNANTTGTTIDLMYRDPKTGARTGYRSSTLPVPMPPSDTSTYQVIGYRITVRAAGGPPASSYTAPVSRPLATLQVKRSGTNPTSSKPPEIDAPVNP